MLTYKLFKIQSVFLWAASREGQLDADLHPVQTQSMLLSDSSRNGQPDADLHSV